MSKTGAKRVPGKLMLVVLAWRGLVTMINWIGIEFFRFEPTFPYAITVLPKYGSRLLTTWAHFDGVHYLTIITHGYMGTGLIQAFFPLYPMLVKLVTMILGVNPILVGSALSTILLALSLYVLVLLLKLEKLSRKQIIKVLVWILIFPTSFYFTSLYSESLYFFWVISCFYLARKQRWFGAALTGLLAGMTRLPGVILAVVILLEYWQANKRFRPQILASLAPIVGLGIYMAYLQVNFNDALLFLHVQTDFGASRETSRLILLHQVFYRYLKMILTVTSTSQLFYQVLLEMLSGILGLIASIYALRRLRPSYAWFTLGSYLLPTLTGTFSSLPRYLMVVFPVYVMLGSVKSKHSQIIMYSLSLILLIVNLILFTKGLWVS